MDFDAGVFFWNLNWRNLKHVKIDVFEKGVVSENLEPFIVQESQIRWISAIETRKRRHSTSKHLQTSYRMQN